MALRVDGWRLMAIAAALGVADALIFLGFEWVVHHGSDWVWNDLADSDDVRWRVVPLALVLSIGVSALLRALGEPRMVPPHGDPLAPAEEEHHDQMPPRLRTVGVTLLVGGACLLAGASLGPEAALVAAAVALGGWASGRGGQNALVLASAGALLVAFFGSLVPLAIPLLLLRRRVADATFAQNVAIVAAGIAAWGTIEVVHGRHEGHGGIPELEVEAHDYATAVVLGAVAVAIGALLHWFVDRVDGVTERLHDRAPWWLAAAVFGGVLGGLYLLGGETVQFSGSDGSAQLLRGEEERGVWALIGLAFVKLAATSWSLAIGYRGGLVFPAVFAGVAVSLVAAETFGDVAGPGILLGCVAGLLVDLTAPVLGVVMLLALLPVDLLPLGLAGAAGAVVARTALTRRGSSRDSPD